MSAGRVGRNDPCPCGSGKKYKYCCMRKDRRRRRARASSPVSPREWDSDAPLGQTLSMMKDLISQTSPDQTSGLQVILGRIEELATYEAMRDEIDDATHILEAHRPEFEALTKDGPTVMKRAHRLFSEQRFAPMRYSAADVHRAFEAVGHPFLYREELSEKDEDILSAAILYLAGDMDQRFRLSGQLMMMMPEYVSAGRYLDAWLIQYSAFQMVEARDTGNPFLLAMFDLAFDEWVGQIEDQERAMIHELGVDPAQLVEMDIEEAEARIKTLTMDPEKMAQVEAYYAAHPMMRDLAEADYVELERGTLQLLERDDVDCLYLSWEEIKAWVPVLMERQRPLEAQAQQAMERGEWLDPDVVQAMEKVFVETSIDMASAIFTPERLDQLMLDLKEYQRNLQQAGEREASKYAHAALILSDRDDSSPADNRFLVGICFASLRSAMLTLVKEVQAKAEGQTETKEGES